MGKLFDERNKGVDDTLGAVLSGAGNIFNEASTLIDGLIADRSCQAGGEIFLWILERPTDSDVGPDVAILGYSKDALARAW